MVQRKRARWDKAPEPRGAVSSGLACVFGILHGKEGEEEAEEMV